MNPLYEPLIPDARLEKIEAQIRRDFPGLPEDSLLFTYIQPAGPHKTKAGIEVEVEALAFIAIVTPNPKHPTAPMLHQGHRPLRIWHQMDYEHRHSSEVASDPLYRDFKDLAPRAVTFYRNLSEMN